MGFRDFSSGDLNGESLPHITVPVVHRLDLSSKGSVRLLENRNLEKDPPRSSHEVPPKLKTSIP